MEVIRGFQFLSRALKHPVLTIGNFDGVHLGHQHIVRLAVEKARSRQGECVAMTFKPHPQAVLRPQASPQLLTTFDEKLEHFERLGADLAIEQPFDKSFASLSAAEFFEKVIFGTVKAEAIVIGYDFGFGKNREGSIQLLSSLAAERGIELTIVPPQSLPGSGTSVISSSRIREFLLKGEVPEANRLLGREFSYRADVVHGDARGRQIGFPTANLRRSDLEGKVILPYGVYATRAFFDGPDGPRELPSVTNIGIRPTFQNASAQTAAFPALVECHVLGERGQAFHGDLYGRRLEVGFVARIREERRFSGMDALKKQISDDVARARQILDGG